MTLKIFRRYYAIVANKRRSLQIKPTSKKGEVDSVISVDDYVLQVGSVINDQKRNAFNYLQRIIKTGSEPLQVGHVKGRC